MEIQRGSWNPTSTRNWRAREEMPLGLCVSLLLPLLSMAPTLLFLLQLLPILFSLPSPPLPLPPSYTSSLLLFPSGLVSLQTHSLLGKLGWSKAAVVSSPAGKLTWLIWRCSPESTLPGEEVYWPSYFPPTVQSAVAHGLASYSIRVTVTMRMRGAKWSREQCMLLAPGWGWDGGWGQAKLSRRSVLLEAYLLSTGVDTSTKTLGSLQI